MLCPATRGSLRRKTKVPRLREQSRADASPGDEPFRSSLQNHSSAPTVLQLKEGAQVILLKVHSSLRCVLLTSVDRTCLLSKDSPTARAAW